MKRKNTLGTSPISSDLIPILLLSVLVCLPFGKVLVSGEALYGSDFLLQFYPWKNFLRDTVTTHGSIPFWNPYLFSGTPFIANIQASIFYPFGFLYYLLPTDVAYLYSTMMHCVLGAVFMYAFLRSLRCSRAGSFLSGLVFIFNGYFMAHLYAGHLSFVQNYIWIPLIVLLTVKFIEVGRLKYAVSGGLILGVQILGGFPQIAFYTILAVLLFYIYSVFGDLRAGHWSNIFRISCGTALIILIGFSLAAVQLLPTYEFMQLSTRAGGIDYSFATMDSLPPRNLLTFLFPLLFGSSVDGTYWISHTGWEFWEFCGYTGVSTLALVLLASRKLLKDSMGLFFTLLILMALFLSLGKFNPVYPFIYPLPGFHNFRIPAQILFLYVFSVAVLSGKALDEAGSAVLFGKGARRIFAAILLILLPIVLWSWVFPGEFLSFIAEHVQLVETAAKPLHTIGFVISQTVLTGCSIFLGAFILLYLHSRESLSGKGFMAGFICLVLVDIGSFSFPMIQTFDMGSALKRGKALAAIRENPPISRSAVNGGCLIANAGLWYRFQDIQGYDPMILRRYVEYINRSQGLPPDNTVVNLHYIRDFTNKLIRMLNLKYVVLCASGLLGKTDPFIPRCRIVHRMVVKERDKVLDFLMSPGFDPIKMLVFEDNEAPINFSCGEPVQPGRETARITWYDNDEIRLTARLDAPGFLVMSEISYPGWEVYVDGLRKEIHTGDYLFRTVPLKAGDHQVRLVFDPASFRRGAAVSLLSLLASGVALFLVWRKKEPGSS